ncbi:hypothetical protein Tco_1399131 [Tanacetum coccineum]
MPSFPSPKPKVNYSNDLDFFKDLENEFLAIVYNDALTSKLDFVTEPTISPQHIDEFNLKDETSLSECDEEEQTVLYFNDLFPFNVIYPDDLKSDMDNGPCYQEINAMVYSKKDVCYEHSEASSSNFLRTQFGESSRATYQRSFSF